MIDRKAIISPEFFQHLHLIMGESGLRDSGTQNHALTIGLAAGFLGKRPPSDNAEVT